MTAQVPNSDFGACSLILHGLRTREYAFTVVALQGGSGLHLESRNGGFLKLGAPFWGSL